MTIKVQYGPDDAMVIHGSSLMGYVTTTYDNLVELFGEPNCPPGDKTWNNWDLCFTVDIPESTVMVPDFDGDEDWKDVEDWEDVYVSIYDWKESSPDHSRIGEYRWHIGGHRGEHRADWLLSDLLLSKDGWPPHSPYAFERRQ